MTFESEGHGAAGDNAAFVHGKTAKIDFLKTGRGVADVPPVDDIVATKETGSTAPQSAAGTNAGDYSAVVFVGGWGASSYQHAFEGTYANAVAGFGAKPDTGDSSAIAFSSGWGSSIYQYAHNDPYLSHKIDVLAPSLVKPYETEFRGGVYVATGGLIGDGTATLAGDGISSQKLAAPPAPVATLGTEIEGTNGNDTMYQGNNSWETLLGLGGNDVFVAMASKSTPAADNWDGGTGINTADFSLADTRVTVDLAAGDAARWEDGVPLALHVVNLTNIQDVVGTARGDSIQGDAAANTLRGEGGNDGLYGREGNDMLIGGSGNDVLVGGAGNDVINGGSGADVIRWNAGDLGFDTIEGFVIGQDTIGFGDGFLASADPVDALLVWHAGADSILIANTQESGWDAIAFLEGVSGFALQAAINNGVLFGYEAGPLGDGAPGGLAGPGRPDQGRGGGSSVSDDVIVDGRIITGENPAPALDHGVTVLAWARVDGVSPTSSGADDLADWQQNYGSTSQSSHSGGVLVAMGDGSVRFAGSGGDDLLVGGLTGFDDGSAAAMANNLKQLGLAVHNYDSGVF
jgi:Ca2+-binding RTX toxin-like protein